MRNPPLGELEAVDDGQRTDLRHEFTTIMGITDIAWEIG
jgi:hypothetical protein